MHIYLLSMIAGALRNLKLAAPPEGGFFLAHKSSLV
jgi:hypothetical protein